MNSITESKLLHSERRARIDRRRANHGLLSAMRLNGRRKQVRRDGDHTHRGYYLDLYEPRLMVASLTILALCVIDAFMTLNLLAHGAEEVNLLMRLLIDEGIVMFLAAKYLVTAASVVFLVMHSRFRLFNALRVHHVLYGCASIYVTLLAYELLLWRIV